jgi:hypothetical protein
MVLLLSAANCGNGKSGGDSQSSAVSQSGESQAGKTADSQDQGSNSAELNVVFNAGEMHSPGTFELKKTFAFIAGMRYNAKSTAKLVYVAFANYDAKLGYYNVDPPKEAGQIMILVSFKTESIEMPMEKQMEEYAKMQVPTGTYKPSWMGDERSFQVVYYMGPNLGGPGLSGSGSSGTAVLTSSTPERVSGSIDFTSEKGSTIKGTFNVKIEKDTWKR